MCATPPPRRISGSTPEKSTLSLGTFGLLIFFPVVDALLELVLQLLLLPVTCFHAVVGKGVNVLQGWIIPHAASLPSIVLSMSMRSGASMKLPRVCVLSPTRNLSVPSTINLVFVRGFFVSDPLTFTITSLL